MSAGAAISTDAAYGKSEKSGINMPQAKTITVIEVRSTRGKGTEASPYRGVIEYFSLDGKLLAESDPLPEHRSCATCNAVLAPGPQPAATYERTDD